MKKITFILLSIFFVGIAFQYFQNSKIIADGSVIVQGDFSLSIENRWDLINDKSYALIDWEEIEDLTQEGYTLYQKDLTVGVWETRSLNYGKQVRVLNVYPNLPASNTFKMWMDSLELKDVDGQTLIDVTPVSYRDFNAAPLDYLKNSEGDWEYDVVMLGTWDANNNTYMEEEPAKYLEEFADSGRGILFGHDVLAAPDNLVEGNRFLKPFSERLGLSFNSYLSGISRWTSSREIQVLNNGYLMKFPFEMEQDMVLDIPQSHNIEVSNKDIGTVWIEFINPSGDYPNRIYDDGQYRGGWYLKTNGNIGMIQTGHSNGASTLDERKIIANVLYNLAQISMYSGADDHSVVDTVPPDAPTLTSTDQNNFNEFTIEIDSTDYGSDYQWYVEASTKNNGVLTSDVVEETIISNIAGYFYRFKTDDYDEIDFFNEVESLKNSYGRIPREAYDVYVAPETEALTEYDTKAKLTLNGTQIFDEYGPEEVSIMVIAVDRANNISSATTESVMDFIEEYRIIESYIGLGEQLKPDTYKIIPKGEDYITSFPVAGEWIPKGYQIRDTVVEGEMRDTVVTIPAINANATITYHYLAPIELNIRQIVVDSNENLVIPDKGRALLTGAFSHLGNEMTQRQNIAFRSGMNEVPYTTVDYPRTFNEHSDGFSIHLYPIIPSFYSYQGALVMEGEFDSVAPIQSEPRLLMDQLDSDFNGDMIEWRNQYWITLFLQPAPSDGNVSLKVVNHRLYVYYANISNFEVYIDGEKYHDYPVENRPSEKLKILDIPIDAIRNRVSVEYENQAGERSIVYWNNSWDYIEGR